MKLVAILMSQQKKKVLISIQPGQESNRLQKNHLLQCEKRTLGNIIGNQLWKGFRY